MASANVFVFIEDSARNPVQSASVILRAPRKTVIGLESSGRGNYAAREIEPGEYVLEVSKRLFLRQTLPLAIRPGRNSAQVVLGKRGELFFYAGGRRIYFERVPNELLIVVRGTDARRLSQEIMNRRGLNAREAGTRLGPPSDDVHFVRIVAGKGDMANSRMIRTITAELENIGLSATTAAIIKRGEGPVWGLTNRLTVQFDAGVSQREVARIAKKYRLKVVRRVSTMANAYVLVANMLPSYDLLNVANQLLQEHTVSSAEPLLLMQLENDQYLPNDPLYNLLAHLPLINCDDAWEILGDWDASLRGGSTEMCIAVFDPNGVAPDHPDLTANLTDGTSKLLQSFDFLTMTAQTAANLSGDHGTECAGSAAAAFDNNLGTTGVAPNCRLIGARLPAIVTDVDMADAFLWAAGIDNGNTDPNFPAFPSQPADVISNSWGSTGSPLSAALQSAFDRLTDEGRGSSGCVVTFSTGNLGYVQFSNLRTFAAYNRTFAVGASINLNPTSPVNSDQADPNGTINNIAVVVDTRTLFNPFGPEMDIVAPSHTCYSGGALVDPITSTVRVSQGTIDGCPGAAVCNDYDTAFGGTSHSSPTIAGTCALILSANPLLAWDEVRQVLQQTAVKIDFTNTDPIGQYVDNDGDGVPEFSQWYGQGRVDVAASVQEALLLYVAELNLLSSITIP